MHISYHRYYKRYYAYIPAGKDSDGSPLTAAAEVTRLDWLLWKCSLGFLVKAKLRRRGVPV